MYEKREVPLQQWAQVYHCWGKVMQLKRRAPNQPSASTNRVTTCEYWGWSPWQQQNEFTFFSDIFPRFLKMVWSVITIKVTWVKRSYKFSRRNHKFSSFSFLSFPSILGSCQRKSNVINRRVHDPSTGLHWCHSWLKSPSCPNKSFFNKSYNPLYHAPCLKSFTT